MKSFFGEPAGIVGGEGNATLVVADRQIRMVIFLVGDVRERIDEGDGLVEIGELVVFTDFFARPSSTL